MTHRRPGGMPCRPTWTATTTSRSRPRSSRGAHALDLRGAGQARRELSELLVRPRGALRVLLRRRAQQGSRRGRAPRGTREMASKIIEVEGQTVVSFLGPVPAHPVGEAYVETAFRTILFTDIVGLDRPHATPRRRQGDGARAHPRPDRARPARRPCAATRSSTPATASWRRSRRWPRDRVRDRDPTGARSAHAPTPSTRSWSASA